MDGTVLVADDDRTIRTVLTQALTRAGCKVHATSSLVTLGRWVEEGRGDLVITDVMMPDGNGIEQIPGFAEKRPGLPVIVISAQNTIVTTIQAAEANAFDYLPKPFDLPDLMKKVGQALEVKRRSVARPQPVETAVDDLPLVGKAPVMQALYQSIAQIMNAEMPVLITGESGSGKSLIARIIHDLSDRRSLPFVVAGSAELASVDGPATLLTKARNGTLLIDEVADLDEAAQSRIVRVMDGLADPSPRIVATSQADLAGLMEQGAFRQDLFYRLNAAVLHIPPLADRIEDIPLLIAHFSQQSEQGGAPLRRFDEKAMKFARRYGWPGNVRQLENIVRRLMLAGGDTGVDVEELSAALGTQPKAEPVTSDTSEKLAASISRHLQRYFDLHGRQLPPAGLYQRVLREVELPLIEIALEATGGNQAKCADLLGINRNTLRKKITDLDIRVTRRRKLM